MPQTAIAQQLKFRIMVVDDEFHIRNSIVQLLEKSGYGVESYDNGGDALAALRQRGSDLVLTDVKMPGMDGVELLGHVRGIDPNLPVILMTAYADLEMAINALKQGAYDFIIKPFDSQTLLATMEKGLKYRHLCQLEKDHMARLETAIVENTQELQELHAQVVLSEKMATVGLLSAGVAHEINNPLAFVSSNLGTLTKYFSRIEKLLAWQTEVINASANPETIREQEQLKRTLKIDRFAGDVQVLLDESLDGVERIKKIVSGLKSFAHQGEDKVSEANLNDLIETTLTIVWHEIKYVAELQKDLGEIPRLNCYPSQLNQVIMNLLVNAAHAIDKGPGTIGIRTWADDAAVYFEVRDSGCGISAENMAKIFAPFFTTKEVGKGTGLGLSICHDIVTKHHGTISVSSEVGKGTSFVVKLPLTQP